MPQGQVPGVPVSGRYIFKGLKFRRVFLQGPAPDYYRQIRRLEYLALNMGDEIKPGQMIEERLMPIFVQDLISTIESEGLARGLLLGTPGFIGIGVQTWEPTEDAKRRKAWKSLP